MSTAPARIALTAETLTRYGSDVLPSHLPPGVTLSDYALTAPDHVVVLARRAEDGAWIVWSHYPNGSPGVYSGDYFDTAERIEARAAFDLRTAGRTRAYLAAAPAPAAPALRTCPGCRQRLETAQGFTECGGEGEGVCAAAAHAFDRVSGAAYDWEGDGAPPSPRTCAAIVRAHGAAIEADPIHAADTARRIADVLWPNGDTGAEWTADTLTAVADTLTAAGFRA